MKSLSEARQSLSEAKQAVKEKLGHAEITEDPELKSKEKVAEELSASLKKLTKTFQRDIKLIQTFCAEDEKQRLSEMFQSLSYVLRDSSAPEQVVLSQCLEKVGEFQSQIEEVWFKLTTTLNGSVAHGLNSLVENELKHAKTEMAKYDKVRLSYDTAAQKLNTLKKASKTKLPKLAEAEVEQAELKVQLDTITKETHELFTDTNFYVEIKMMSLICNYIEVYSQFLENGTKLVSSFIPTLSTYKQFIESEERRVREFENQHKSDHDRSQTAPQLVTEVAEESNNTKSNMPNSPGRSESGSSALHSLQANLSNLIPTSPRFKKHSRHSPFNSPANTERKHESKKLGLMFGQPLDVVLKREEALIPSVVVLCVRHLDKYGLDSEGIFRHPGKASRVNDFKAAFDEGKPVEFAENDDVYAVADLMKDYFQSLPEPLIPSTLTKSLIRIVDLPDAQKANAFKAQLAELPDHNLTSLRYVIRFLGQIAERETNNMSAGSLATIWALLLMNTNEGIDFEGVGLKERASLILSNVTLSCLSITTLIQQHKIVFPATA